MVCEGCGKDPLSPKVVWKNAQARCINYENLHNVDLEKTTNLKSAKEIWRKLQVLFGGDNNNNGEVEKKSKKKKTNKDSQKIES